VQGVIGLKAIRVNVLYHPDEKAFDKAITYDGLIDYLR